MNPVNLLHRITQQLDLYLTWVMTYFSISPIDFQTHITEWNQVVSTMMHPIQTLLRIAHQLQLTYDLHSVVEHDLQTLIPELKQYLVL